MMHGRQDLSDGAARSGGKQEDVRRVGTVRVYEVAKEVGLANKELVAKIQALGIEVKNHMSSLELDDVLRVKRALEKERQEHLVEERLSPTVIRRRSKVPVVSRKPAPPPEGKVPSPEPRAPIAVASPERPHAEVQEPAPEPEEPIEVGEVPVPSEVPEEEAEEVFAGEQASEIPLEAAPPAAEEAVPEEPVQAAPPPPEREEPVVPPPPVVAPAPQPVSAAPERTEEKREEPAAAAPAPAAAAPAEQPKEPEKPAVVHRYAPGFKPGMQYGPRGRPQQVVTPPPAHAQGQEGEGSGDQAISAADAMRMMGPLKPKVVITEVDGRKPGMRREMVTHKDLFADRRFKAGGNKKKKVVGNKKSRKTEITTPAQHKRVIRLEDAIAVGDLARQMGIKSTEVLKRLWAMGMTNVNINQVIDGDTASLLASEFGYEVEDVSFSEQEVLQQSEDRPEDLRERPPVVTVMGHVDHGKTSLLDAIRDTQVASGEAGGITQHIGASVVKTKGGELVFLDTPGHEAFTLMRARGAQCTDIVVLVVAADDGVMPQTIEAVDHAKSAEVPIIVAVNKIDRPDANPDRVRTQLAERGLVPEEWGGETQYVNVSARTKDGIDQLLESLTVQAELLELRANPDKLAAGTIIEAKLDKARGAMCSVLIQEGTLHVGDIVVTGEHMGKVRAMIDSLGRLVREAGPSMPVEILGLGGVPLAGDTLNAVADEKAARSLAEHRHNEARRREMAGASASKTYEEILGQIRSGEAKEIKLLLKTDVQGSAEALREALTKLSTEKVSANVISAAVGGINETDVNLAKAAGALIVGFNVRAAGKAAQLAEREGVEIRTCDVIYDMLDDVKAMMQGLLPKERREKFLGRAEVRETFSIPKVGTVAGCGIQEGKVTRNSHLRLVRDNIKIYDGRVGSLRRFKDDVREVQQGYECGLSIDGYNDIRVGDVIEAYEYEEVAPSLT